MAGGRRHVRRARANRQRKGVRTNCYIFLKTFAAGAGQINITGKQFGFIPNRLYRPVRASFQLSLISEAPHVGAEGIVVKVYDWANQGDVIACRGPILVGTVPKRVSIRFPRIPPTQLTDADMSSRKLLSIYDFGADSKMGLVVSCHLWVSETPGDTLASLAELPEKFEVLSL